MREPAGRIKALLVLAVLAIGAAGAVLAVRAPADNGHDFHGSPVPPLFGDAQIAPVDAELRAARAQGHRLAAAWLDAHPVATDEQFGTWAVQAVGPPPGRVVARRELARLRRIAAHRDPQGVRAAVWLEQHGKKQPWKVLRNQTEPFAAPGAEEAAKATLKAAFDLGTTLEDAAKARYRRAPPYAADPRLNAGGVRVDTGPHQSYPSSHMVDAGVGLAVLEVLDPHLSGEYGWMADEVAYSRLYTGGHYPSDLRAGIMLGTMVADYELRKQGFAA